MSKYKLLPPESDIYNPDGSYRDPSDYQTIGEEMSLVSQNKTGGEIKITFHPNLTRGLVKQLGVDFIRQQMFSSKQKEKTKEKNNDK